MATTRDPRLVETAALIAGVMAGALLLIAALLFYFHWLTTPSMRQSWTVTALVVLPTQVLVASGHDSAEPVSGARTQLMSSGVDLLATALVLALMVLGTRAVRNPRPLLLGTGLATALMFMHVLAHVETPLSSSAPASGVVAVAIVLGHLGIARLVLRDHSQLAWARHRLALTVISVGVAHAARSGAFDAQGCRLGRRRSARRGSRRVGRRHLPAAPRLLDHPAPALDRARGVIAGDRVQPARQP
ncbi:hypothetical protein [Nocardioides sp. B-3]|uniref:hypothetical protein n=1 Tax=Nocardioides sp. B-3 TaxID=2895565 RepID=UPI002152507A|nr:hypothetical protein [Nocardioides sp. B-3]UUZ60402.1 hypothetical protein LP418_05755 [Nocardioides sp. B-3]